MSRNRLIIYLVLLAIVLATSWWVRFGRPGPNADVPSAQAHEGGPYLRGTHWFGEGWAVNMWNTALLEQARSDFPQLREDGFNTVVLVVPWPGFAASRTDGQIDPDRVRRLLALIDLAAENELQVVLRVGYAWDSAVERPGEWLVEMWHDEAVYEAWLDYVEALWAAVGDRENLAFGFLAWEDFWAITWLGDAPEKRRLERAGPLGYTAWLRERMSLGEVSRVYGREFAAWNEVPAPARKHPGYALFLEFMDDAWVNRFFVPAQARFPRLSMEIRIDSDPVYGEDGEVTEWYVHEPSWDLPGAEWVTIYWSPAMGGLNQGERLEPETAAERLQMILERVRNVTGNRRIFIDQFLVEDYTPGYDNNGRLAPEDIPEFLEQAAPVLQGYAEGYALWTWKDYIHNAVPSPDFSNAALGWTLPGDRAVDAGTGLVLEKGQHMARTFRRPEFHAPGGPATATFCVTAEPHDGTGVVTEMTATVTLDSPVDPDTPVTLAAIGTPECVDLDVEWNTDVSLFANADLVIEKLSFSGFTQPIGIRDLQGRPKPVTPAWVRLNKTLKHTRTMPFSLHEDGWMGRALDTSPTLPVVTGSRPDIVIETSLPGDWPFTPRVTVRHGETTIGEFDCGRPGENRFPLPDGLAGKGKVRLTLALDRVWSPPGDDRRLGCQVKRVALGIRP